MSDVSDGDMFFDDYNAKEMLHKKSDGFGMAPSLGFLDQSCKSELQFLQKLIDAEEFMADTINTEHPNYEGSEEQSAYRTHQHNIVMLEKVKSRLQGGN